MFTLLTIIATAASVALPDIHPVLALFVTIVTAWRASGDIEKALTTSGDTRRKHMDAATACMVIVFTCVAQLAELL